jgi:hypothetical protein
MDRRSIHWIEEDPGDVVKLFKNLSSIKKNHVTTVSTFDKLRLEGGE